MPTANRMPRGVMQAPVTPFLPDHAVDFPTLERLVDWHTATDRNIGIVALFNKAEPLSLTLAERMDIARVTVDVVAGRLPVIVHVGHPCTDIAVELAVHAEAIGAFGVISIHPYYWSPTEEGLRRHFEAILDAVQIGVLAYNSPWRIEGPSLTPDLLLDLSRRYPHFIGVKDASFNLDYIADICRALQADRPDFAVNAGVEYLLGSVVLGGTGSFSAVGAVAPRMVYDLWDAVEAGRWDEARVLQHRVTHLHQHFKDYYPSGLKVAMEVMGRPVGPCRLPLPTGGPEMRGRIERTLAEYGVVESERHGW